MNIDFTHCEVKEALEEKFDSLHIGLPVFAPVLISDITEIQENYYTSYYGVFYGSTDLIVDTHFNKDVSIGENEPNIFTRIKSGSFKFFQGYKLSTKKIQYSNVIPSEYTYIALTNETQEDPCTFNVETPNYTIDAWHDGEGETPVIGDTIYLDPLGATLYVSADNLRGYKDHLNNAIPLVTDGVGVKANFSCF